MVKGFYRLSAVILLLFSGLYASGRGSLYHIYKKQEKKATLKTTTPHKNPFSYEYNLNNVALQVINIQQHRGAHSFQGYYHTPDIFSIGIRYITLACGRNPGELTLFRKLILFPFHDFW